MAKTKKNSIGTVPFRIKTERHLVQSRVDAEVVSILQENGVDIPELIRRACAKAAQKITAIA